MSCIVEIEGDISPLPGNAAGKKKKKDSVAKGIRYQDGGKTYVRFEVIDTDVDAFHHV